MKKILFSILMLSTSIANAQLTAPIKWSKITLSGKGCPSPQQSTLISPDGGSLSIIFQGLSLEYPFVGDPSTQGDVRELRGLVTGDLLGVTVFKSCNVSLEFQVPNGQYVESAAVKVDWRGSIFLEKGISGRLKTLVTYPAFRSGRLSRASTVLIDKAWRESDEEFTLTNSQKVISALGCNTGSTQTIEFKQILLLTPTSRATQSGASALLTTDTSDATLPGMDVDVVLKPCK
ncbi:MAG: hypothetical protein QE271_05375 [Bacteriovoracaceae bacterium]|nr:hypothetical protein [Bacteriovoracaceae bacterium]